MSRKKPKKKLKTTAHPRPKKEPDEPPPVLPILDEPPMIA